MKNILTAVFLIGFLCLGTGLFGQSEKSVIMSLQPCSTLTNVDYRLYLKTIPSSTNYIKIVPTGVGTGLGTEVNFGKPVRLPHAAANSTEWAYAIDVTWHGPILIDEYYTQANGVTQVYRKRIRPRALQASPVPITNIEILKSDLCAGTMTVRCNSSNTHASYDWYYRFGGTIGYTFLGETRSAEADFTLNNGNSIINNSSIELRVKVRNDCGVSPFYSEIVPLAAPTPTAAQLANLGISRVGSGNYCPGRKNEFKVDNYIDGIEYQWVASTNSEEGLNLESFFPDLGNVGDVSTLIIILNYRVNCTSGWQQAAVYFEPVQYDPCNIIHNRTTTDQDQLDAAIGELSSIGSNEGTATDNSSASKLSTLDNMENALTAFPNPTTGLLELNSESEKIEAVKVYNVTGVLVTQQLNVNTTNPTLDLSKLPKGMYMVNIQTPTTNKTIQVIKE